MAVSLRLCCCIALCCLSCQPNVPRAELGNALPMPPHADLTDSKISFGEEGQAVCASATIEETIASIQRLESLPSRGRYRAHLEELSARLFQQVASSEDLDAVIMTLLATTACHHPLSRTISGMLIRSGNPIIQLSAVQALSSLNTSEADEILTEALRSDYVAVRLEAAWKIAAKRSPQAFVQIDALSHKLPESFRPCLPELYAVEGSLNSIHRIRQLLIDPDDDVVIESLIAVGQYRIIGCDDLLLSMDPHSPAVLEALAFSLRSVDSEESRARLHLLADHSCPCVRIQAALTLVAFGEPGYLSTIHDCAAAGDLFAVAALSECREPLAADDFTDPSRPFRMNVSLALLNQKDIRCVKGLKELISLPDDEVLYHSISVGHSLWYWDAAAIDSFDASARPVLKEQALVAKELLLVRSLDLSEEAFAEVARAVFVEDRIDLFPCLVQLLENQRSDAAVDILRQESLRVGAPYHRAFAMLSLVRLGIEQDEKNLTSILDFARERDGPSWRPPLPWFAFTRADERPTSQQAAASAELYIGALQALSMLGTDAAVDTLSAELSKAPKKYLPFVAASLLHATL